MVGTELARLEKVQEALAERISLRNRVGKLGVVAGADCAAGGGRIFCAVVACEWPSMKVVEEKTFAAKESFPYVPGFLSFREAPATIRAFRKLRLKPGVLFVNGCGINHPRGIGLASHVGVLLSVPSIGVTKELLCGKTRGKRIMAGGKVVGSRVGNVFVSPGHLVSVEKAGGIAAACMRGHRLPEPLFLAHAKANEVKKRWLSERAGT